MLDLVPAFDYRRDLQRYRVEIDEAIARVIDSGWLILGPEVEAFEHAFANSVNVKHAIGVASGTDALILALRAVGVKAGDEVITVANTAVPTVSAIRAIDAIPRFVDIDASTLQMSTTALRAAMRSAVRCIIPVHLHGHPADIEAIESIADAHGTPVVSDCAQAHGAMVGNQSVGQFSSICCYSFYPTKNLAALGDGGICVTRSDTLAETLRELRQYGFHNDRTAHREGVCSRLDELQSAVLSVRLAHFEANQRRRDEIADHYFAGLSGSEVQLPSRRPGIRHAWHQFVVRTVDRPALIARLQAAKIGFGIHYPQPIHLMPAYQFLGYKKGDLLETERAADEILSLPMFPGLRDDEVERVIAAVRGTR
ncbi:DegT/DnrJ/EryC1/StrS family aminotransferase [Novipirellula sp. SH528]|uniref:DegT/DnrJ/EryC1/StrS family aminotransferase n=1 Tax=Novipirellula sp. SH528 TaxID=3454466 RepID=UPI003F9F1BEB